MHEFLVLLILAATVNCAEASKKDDAESNDPNGASMIGSAAPMPGVIVTSIPIPPKACAFLSAEEWKKLLGFLETFASKSYSTRTLGKVKYDFWVREHIISGATNPRLFLDCIDTLGQKAEVLESQKLITGPNPQYPKIPGGGQIVENHLAECAEFAPPLSNAFDPKTPNPDYETCGLKTFQPNVETCNEENVKAAIEAEYASLEKNCCPYGKKPVADLPLVSTSSTGYCCSDGNGGAHVKRVKVAVYCVDKTDAEIELERKEAVEQAEEDCLENCREGMTCWTAKTPDQDLTNLPPGAAVSFRYIDYVVGYIACYELDKARFPSNNSESDLETDDAHEGPIEEGEGQPLNLELTSEVVPIGR